MKDEVFNGDKQDEKVVCIINIINIYNIAIY